MWGGEFDSQFCHIFSYRLFPPYYGMLIQMGQLSLTDESMNMVSTQVNRLTCTGIMLVTVIGVINFVMVILPFLVGSRS